jgi:DNA-3-methyladenine glycosylase II
VLATPPEALRAAGLSAAKTAAIRDLATRITEGDVPVDDLHRLTDEDVVERLTRVRGIGRWTAEMYLMFNLRRPDVWPVDDLGVRSGYGLIFGRPTPTPKELMPEGERFRPHRSVVAWYCWQAVHRSRGHD